MSVVRDKKSADIFCRIIDNYGDIGVCWRLARQLHAEHAFQVTLWVDDLATFARLSPAINPLLPTQELHGLTVRHWAKDFCADENNKNSVCGDLIIEGFACEVPPAFLRAMQAREQKPLWINLEYLSAEPWVEDCHGLPSTHAQTGLTKYFWFPGFTTRSGGLLREKDLLQARDLFQKSAAAQADFFQRIGIANALSFAQRISLFAYENPALPEVLSSLKNATHTSLLVIPQGRAQAAVAAWLGVSDLPVGSRVQRGALTVVVIALLSHSDYDKLLWACSFNFVRGEDSFVRAQWAARPFLWHIYPQAEQAHQVKLSAFIQKFSAVMPEPVLWGEAMQAWNGADKPTAFWSDFFAALPALNAPACAWSQHLAEQNDLAAGLVRFLRSRLE